MLGIRQQSLTAEEMMFEAEYYRTKPASLLSQKNLSTIREGVFVCSTWKWLNGPQSPFQFCISFLETAHNYSRHIISVIRLKASRTFHLPSDTVSGPPRISHYYQQDLPSKSLLESQMFWCISSPSSLSTCGSISVCICEFPTNSDYLISPSYSSSTSLPGIYLPRRGGAR